MGDIYAFIAGFTGAGVEFVEALTVVLAITLVRGWKPAVSGTAAALAILGVIIAIVGMPLVQVMHIDWVQAIVGMITLLFGIRWLRKSILRYAGLKALHNEDEAFQKEMDKQQKVKEVNGGFDRTAFIGAFSITFLEGMEAVFIVLTFGSSLHAMKYTILGAVIASLTVIVVGLLVRKPLAKVPENTMKYVIGIMLTSFGAFWTGEGIGVQWPQADVSILYIAGTLVLFSFLLIKKFNHPRNKASKSKQSGGISV